MKKYTHLFFDLDHTLWDFDSNTTDALMEIYEIYDFSKWRYFNFQKLLVVFNEINNFLWDKYNHGLIEQMELRNNRFQMILGKLGVPEEEIPNGIGDKYVEITPEKRKVMPFSYEVLDYLQPNYNLHILSNGFDDIQHKKLKAANIYHYFNKIITSDSSGFRKPSKEIFEYAMKIAGATRANSLMIGDNMDTDIIGAQNASMDHMYYNPNETPHTLNVNFEIKSLKQILQIL